MRLGELSDIGALLAFYCANKDFLEPWEPLKPEDFYGEEFWRQRILKDHEEFRNGQSLRLVLFDRRDTGLVVGSLNFSNFVRGAFHACYLGISLAEGAQGRGLMAEALPPAIEYVFGTLNIHRIMANYMPRNHRSGKLLKRLGFVEEGLANHYLRIAGRWEDHTLTSLTNENWASS